ncbi:MAG TPA: cysteine hydrolase [Candidatus Binatia bacterium]
MKMKALYAAVMLALLFATAAPLAAQTKDVIDEWASVQAPKPPELKPVTLEPSTTALLVLDFIKQTCNSERRPRCLASIPKVEGLLKQARAKKLTVIHSIPTNATPGDIAKELAPADGEPIVKSSADKFLGTDLEKILKEKGVKTVIVTGTAAHGAVLYTGSEAAYRGFKVVVPVDGMSSENTYFEQYTAYQMANGPGIGQNTTLTRIEMIK